MPLSIFPGQDDSSSGKVAFISRIIIISFPKFITQLCGSMVVQAESPCHKFQYTNKQSISTTLSYSPTWQQTDTSFLLISHCPKGPASGIGLVSGS
ncbi:hypothetical protein MKW98_012073 [Papaver atlanticum]|uniref:Uncharacterized protein n=1 Tax=Papaver atlanticum TaxID=357466 RepID=A0AAD4TEL1_9MAGN|nr:hypothetical protein MKW98_012073 [Papaver atlanticum]